MSRLRRRARPAVYLVLLLAALSIVGSLVVGAGGRSPSAAPVPGLGTMSTHPLPSSLVFPAHVVPLSSIAAGTPVNPYRTYSAEPAPMGVADFGVTGASGNVQAYSYDSREFQGDVHINNMLTSGGGGLMSFQLNLLLVFRLGFTNYSYWVQDVAEIDSNNGGIGLVDNIWNFSQGDTAAGGPIVGDVSGGNGSAGTSGGYTLYADQASTGYPGNGIYLTYPTNLSLRLVDSTISGSPMVGFEYNDGYGWVTYDNVTFPHMKQATNYGFVVDGTQYEPIGGFYDAEWVYCGGSYGLHNVHSDLAMSLMFWNGHNFQAPPNAFNFGGNTAESLDNVVSSLGVPPANGSLFSHVTNGSGSLDQLYNASQVGTLDIVTSPLLSGAVGINGTLYSFRGGSPTFTLAPGQYNLSLYVNGSWVDSAGARVLAGSTTHVLLPRTHYAVQFSETGLPSGTDWRVSAGGGSFGSVGPVLNVTLPNGTYTWQVAPIAGFVPSAYSGTLSVNGGSPAVLITFRPFTYLAQFAVFDLPSGTAWSVVVGGASYSSNAATQSVAEPNGSYQYNVSTVWSYEAQPSGGVLTINGAATLVQVTFGLRLGSISGTVYPTNATVSIDNASVQVVGGVFQMPNAPPGEYSVEAVAPGYSVAWENLTVTAGNTSRADFTLHPAPSQSNGGSHGGNPSSGGTTLGTTDLLALLVVIIAVGGVAAVAVARRSSRRRP